MTPELKKKALALTQQIVSDYWKGKTDLFFDCMDDTILWIGALENEYLQGAEQVQKHVQDILTVFPTVYLLNEVYTFGPVSRSFCTITGSFTGYTDPSSGQLFSETQRISYIWYCPHRTDDDQTLRLIHVHISNLWHSEAEKKQLPIKAGPQTYDYLQMFLRLSHEHFFNEDYFFKSTDNSYYHVHSNDILYLEANRKDTMIHCRKQAITVNIGIQKLAAMLPDTFIPIHRSYVINPTHLCEMKRSWLLLSDNTRLDIPVKHYAALKKGSKAPLTTINLTRSI